MVKAAEAFELNRSFRPDVAVGHLRGLDATV